MRTAHGSSLHLARKLRWTAQLQIFYAGIDLRRIDHLIHCRSLLQYDLCE